MKTFIINFLVIACFLADLSYHATAQTWNTETTTFFSNRISSPIQVVPKQIESKIYFEAVNKSLHPYEVTVKFKQSYNLTPVIPEKTYVVYPGTMRLFTLNLVDSRRSTSMDYSVFYVMGDHQRKANPDHPYLVPVGCNKSVELEKRIENNTEILFLNHFKMQMGDTVYCARKGIVTASPDNLDDVERIVKSTFEVRHEDGTIAVYYGIDPEKYFIKTGQTVYPGQAVGLVGDQGILILGLFEFKGDGIIQSMKIKYAGQDEKTLTQEEIAGKISFCSPSVIKMELSRKELKKFEAKELF